MARQPRLFEDEARQIRPGRGPRVIGDSDLVELNLTLREDRPVSIAVTNPHGAAAKWVWLPKSQIDYAHAAGGKVMVRLPGWMAKDKELI